MRCATCRAPFTPQRSTARYCKPYCRLAAHRRRQRQSVHFSSRNQRWRTPALVLDRVRLVAPIDLDPCAARDGLVHATVEIYEDQCNGLVLKWASMVRTSPCSGGLVYCNSPYGRALPAWMAKCAAEHQAGADVIALPPARPGSRWWQAMCASATLICFFHGRLRFLVDRDNVLVDRKKSGRGLHRPVGDDKGAPFPSAAVLWTHDAARAARFRAAFSDVGRVVAP